MSSLVAKGCLGPFFIVMVKTQQKGCERGMYAPLV